MCIGPPSSVVLSCGYDRTYTMHYKLCWFINKKNFKFMFVKTLYYADAIFFYYMKWKTFEAIFLLISVCASQFSCKEHAKNMINGAFKNFHLKHFHALPVNSSIGHLFFILHTLIFTTSSHPPFHIDIS